MLQEAVLNVFSVDLPSAKPFEPNTLRWDISMPMTVIPGVHPVAQHLPHGQASGGDRHLNFHETRDNLLLIGQPGRTRATVETGRELRLPAEATRRSAGVASWPTSPLPRRSPRNPVYEIRTSTRTTDLDARDGHGPKILSQSRNTGTRTGAIGRSVRLLPHHAFRCGFRSALSSLVQASIVCPREAKEAESFQDLW